MSIKDFEELEASASQKKALATARLKRLFDGNAAAVGGAINHALTMVISDRLYYPEKMKFVVDIMDQRVKLMYDEEPGRVYTIHPHALGQMSDVIKGSRTFFNSLREGQQWERELLAHTLNECFHKREFKTAKGTTIKYLRRAVGDQVRGFQGRNFGRNIATTPLLKAFVEACRYHQAGVLDGHTTDVRVFLHTVLPVIFEPIKNELVVFGMSFGNSDFGAGKLAVNGTVMRISSGTTAITHNLISKVHIGKVIDAGDDEDVVVSDATIIKEVEVHKSAIKDVVDSYFSVKAITQQLDMIDRAHKHGIEWYRLRTSLAKTLSKKELEFVKQLLDNGDDLMDLPPAIKTDDETSATSWWAANVVGWLANKEEDPTRQHEMRELAGSLLE